jgi:HAD superfamily hydrolase (TIGR01509 family)
LRKPEDGIYQLALEVTQKPARECCFVDDRALNLDAAARLGMHTIKMEDAQQLKREFEKLEIVA